MTFDISKYPEPEDYGEVLLRLMASPHRRRAPDFPGAESLPGAQRGDVLILVGETKGDLSGSLYAREWLGLDAYDLGTPPQVDLAVEMKNADFVRSLIEQHLVNAVHCVSDGGVACSAVDMALLSDVGVALFAENMMSEDNLDLRNLYFSEFPGRYLLAMSDKNWSETLTKIVGEDPEFPLVDAGRFGKQYNEETYPIVGLFSQQDAVIPLSKLRDVIKP